MSKWKWPGLAAVFCFAALATAQPQPVQEQVINRDGVSFTSGGIGIDSQERLQAREQEFNLKLVFTLVEGNYLADVAVSVKGADGRTLIEHVANGPFFLARLPAGTYAVTAVHEGKPQVRKVTVSDKRLRTEYLRWPGTPGTDFPLPAEGAKK
ncbi:MAG: hypothetical protein KIT18_08725 [Burkholderiales bacterium]|nr:hypothetical protein [Burkholderiales bacterium]